MSDPDCARMRLLAQADLDGELSVAETASLAAHLAGCADCRAMRAALGALSAALRAEAPRHAAPDALRRRLQAEAAAGSAPRRARWAMPAAAGAALALAASALLTVQPGDHGLAEQAAASHIRALQPGHLTDVASTDQHTVKPWFAGKLDYAPPVRDFAPAGYRLIGGRLDYLDGRAVAALVYGRDRHLIDLYVWPGDSGRVATTVAGHSLRGWSEGGMRFLAISDLNPTELDSFAALWRAGPP